MMPPMNPPPDHSPGRTANADAEFRAALRRTAVAGTKAALGWRVLRLLLCGWLLLAGPRDVAAAAVQSDAETDDVDTGGLDIEASLGWDGIVDQATPLPISLLITNFSPAAIEAELVLKDIWNNNELRLGEVYISQAGTRRFQAIEALPDWHSCHIELRTADHVYWRRELPLNTGRQFTEDLNYLMTIDDSGRTLRPPGVTTETVNAAPRYRPPEGEGRTVEFLTVESWQLPRHAGPLTVVQAIVFAEATDTHQLASVQWEALTRWMCLGGTVFVHEQHEDVIEQLRAASPLAVHPPETDGPFEVHRVGGGSYRVFREALFSAEGGETRSAIAAAAARLPKSDVLAVVDAARVYERHNGNAGRNRMLVVAFFALYTLLSGGVTLALFRLSRSRIAAFITVVVLGASVLAGMLGGLLRYSAGDLRWVTVSTATDGGLVQAGRIEIRSAGGRNTRVGVGGSSPDLQLMARSHYHRQSWYWYSSGGRRPSHYPAFAWQPDLAGDIPGTYQVGVPITPWGERELMAASFKPDVPLLEVEITATAADLRLTSPADDDDDAPETACSVRLHSRLPWDLSDCFLLTGTSRWQPAEDNRRRSTYYAPGGRVIVREEREDPESGELQLVDVYRLGRIGNLPSGIDRRQRVLLGREREANDWQLQRGLGDGQIRLPRVAFPGATGAWIVGRLAESPDLQIDPQRSEFVLTDELHVFLQQIPPESLPAEWEKRPDPEAGVVP